MKHDSFCYLVAAALCLPVTGFARQTIAEERVTPPLNTESTAQIGAEILHQGELYQRAAIHLSEEITFGKDGAYALTPGYYFRGGDSIGWETYAPADGPEAGSVKKAPGAITLQGSFHYSNDGKTIGVITNFYQAINTKAKGITRTTRPAISPDAFSGHWFMAAKREPKSNWLTERSGRTSPGHHSDVFVEYDLADSKVVEIKGARIEVMEATNNSIRYRVTQAFDSTKK